MKKGKYEREIFAANTASMVSYGFLGLLRSLSAAGVSDAALGNVIRISNKLTKKAVMDDISDIEGLCSAYSYLLTAMKGGPELGIDKATIEEHRELISQATRDMTALTTISQGV